MNNPSNERITDLIARIKMFGHGAGYSADEVLSVLSELLAYREAQGKAVGFRWRHHDSNYDHDWMYVQHRDPDKFERQHVVQYLYLSSPLPDLPDVLPCPVKLEPGLILGKGVKTHTLLDALIRREKYYAELEAMTPEQRAEHEEGIASIKSMLATANHAEVNSPEIPDSCDNTTQQFESLSK